MTRRCYLWKTLTPKSTGQFEIKLWLCPEKNCCFQKMYADSLNFWSDGTTPLAEAHSDVLPLVVDYYISYRLLWSEFNYIKAHTCHGQKTLKIKKKLKFGFNFGPPYIFWSNDNMAALLKWDLSLTYSDSTVCLLTSKTKKTWTQNKKNWKNLGKFQAVFSQFLHFKWLQIL